MNHYFEKMMPEHQTDVMEIYNYYIQNSFAAYPENRLPDIFFSKFLEIGNIYPAFVIKDDNGSVFGFCLIRPYNPFPVFKETAEVTYFIRKDSVRKGIGRSALMKLEEEAKKIGITRLLADISSENTESIDFHKNNGFSQCGFFNNIGRKFDKRFSVVWMEKFIG